MLQLRGQRLTLEQIADVASGREQVALADDARARIEASRAVVERSSPRTARFTESIPALESCLMFASIRDDLRRAAAQSGSQSLLRTWAIHCLKLKRAQCCCCAQTCWPAGSAARVRSWSIRCSQCSRRGVTPVIPEKGSVGASGDLAPLAHLALVAIGEGEAFTKASGCRGARLCSARESSRSA